MLRRTLAIFICLALPGTILAAPPEVARLAVTGLNTQSVTAVDWAPEGNLALAGPAGLWLGKSAPTGGHTWQTYWHDGLNRPGAVLLQDDKATLVLQTAELSRLIDLNADGTGDLSEVVLSAWGLNVGPPDQGTAPRALFRRDGSTLLAFASAAGNWAQRNPVPLPPKDEHFTWIPRWAGCLVLLAKDGRTTSVVAAGFSQVTALASGPEGQVFVLDAHSPWGAPAVYQLELNAWYGNPESLPQLPPPATAKGKTKSTQANAAPTPPSAQFPLALLPPSVCEHPSALAWVRLPGSGPNGDLIVGDASGGRLARVRLYGEGDHLKGCAGPWLSSSELAPGINALAPSPDGASLLAGLKSGAGVVLPTEPAAFHITELEIRDGWLECHFSSPLAQEVIDKAGDWPLAQWPLVPGRNPGEPQLVRSIRHIIEPEGTGVSFLLPPGMPPQALLAVDFRSLRSGSGDRLQVSHFFLPAQFTEPARTVPTPAPGAESSKKP